MKLSDLKTGMRVRMRDGNLRLVLRDVDCIGRNQKLFFARFDGNGFMIGTCYSDDMLENSGSDEFDIVAVYNVTDKYDHCGQGGMLDPTKLSSPIWTRKETKETKEMTVAEISKELGYEVKVVEG